MNTRIAFVIVAILLADQATKLLVENEMYLGETILVIPRIFHFTYIINPGAAFGIFPHQQLFFIIVGILMVGIGLWAVTKLEHYGRLFVYGVALMIGGALGNIFDRIRLAGVVDFLDFRIWPIFNVADIGIVCGAAAVIWSFWQMEKKEINND